MLRAKDMARIALANRPDNHLVGTFVPMIERRAEDGLRHVQFNVSTEELYFLFEAERELERAGFVVHRLNPDVITDILVTW